MNTRLNFLVTAVLFAAPQICMAQSLTVGDTASNQLQITGESPKACIISAPNQYSTTNASLAATASSAQVTVTNLVNPVTAVPNDASIDIEFPVICNTAHRVTVSTSRGGLYLQSPAPAAEGFRDHLPYSVTATWAGQQFTSATDGPMPIQIQTDDAMAGQLEIAIQIRGGGDPLIAGTYSDALVVNLQPLS